MERLCAPPAYGEEPAEVWNLILLDFFRSTFASISIDIFFTDAIFDDVCIQCTRKVNYVGISALYNSIYLHCPDLHYIIQFICIVPDHQKYGQVCQTQYETSCVTKYKDTPVVENVEECNKVKYKYKYKYKIQIQRYSFR